MKKILLLTLSAAISFSSFAQKNLTQVANFQKADFQVAASATHHMTANKSNGVTDTTIYYYNQDLSQMFDSSVAYYYDRVTPRDSGYYIGMNASGFKGAAETYLYPYHADT